MNNSIVAISVGHAYDNLRNYGLENNNLEPIKNIFQVNNLSQLINNIANINKSIDLNHYDDCSNITQATNKAKGDLFEVFSAIWLSTFGGDRHYSIMNIKWAPRDQKGYDFTATNHNNRPVFIQSKFRSNINEEFESNQLETFLIEGKELNTPTVHYLFTNSKKVSSRYRTAEREGKMRIIDYNEINKHTNEGFWSMVREVTNFIFV
jgi:hypothetical protein